MKINSNKNKKGFTLIELLIAIAIIGIISVVAFVSLNPGARLQDARDAKRWSDVSAVLDAVKIDQVDNRGSYLSPAISTTLPVSTPTMIGTGSACNVCDACTSCTGPATPAACLDISGLVTEGYLAAIPESPDGSGTWDGATSGTGYYITKSTTGAITIGACESENTTAISVSR